MFGTITEILARQIPSWSAVLSFVAGALIGWVGGTYINIWAVRPKLIHAGDGTNRRPDGRQLWYLSVMNRPSFLGLRFAGETAKSVSASIQPLHVADASPLPLYWQGDSPHPQIDLAPAAAGTIGLFAYIPGKRGYYVLDHLGEPIAGFEARETKFALLLGDQLGRQTRLLFTANFDESHLKNPPQLSIRQPFTKKKYLLRIYRALRNFLRSFRMSA